MSIAAEAAGSGELVLSQTSLARLREALSAREAEAGPDAALQEEGAPVAAPEAGVEAGPEAGCFVLRGLRSRPPLWPSPRPPQALSTVSSVATIVHRATETLSTGLSGPWSGYLSQPRLTHHHLQRDGSSSSPGSSPDSRAPADCASCAVSAGGTVQLRRLSTVRSLPQLPSTVHRRLSLCSMRRSSIASAAIQHAQSGMDPWIGTKAPSLAAAHGHPPPRRGQDRLLIKAALRA